MLMYVRRLNNYQNSMLSPFLDFPRIFAFLEIFPNGFFDHVRKFLQICLHAGFMQPAPYLWKEFSGRKKTFCAPCLIRPTVYMYHVNNCAHVHVLTCYTNIPCWQFRVPPETFPSSDRAPQRVHVATVCKPSGEKTVMPKE